MDTYEKILEKILNQKFQTLSLVFADHEHGRVHVGVRNVHDRPEVFFTAEKVTDSFFAAGQLDQNYKEAYSLREALWMIGIYDEAWHKSGLSNE